MTIVIHNLATNAHRLQACQLAQIHRSFGMTCAHQDATLASTQREHMTRTTKIPGLSTLISAFLHGISTLIGGNTRGSVHMVDGYRKSGFMIIRVLGDHGAELQLIHDFARCRHANQAAGLLGHEVNGLRSAELRRHDQIALVFPILIIGYQHHFTSLNSRNGLLNRIIFKIHSFHLTQSRSPAAYSYLKCPFCLLAFDAKSACVPHIYPKYPFPDSRCRPLFSSPELFPWPYGV